MNEEGRWPTGRGPLISGLPPPGWSPAVWQRWPWEMSRKKRRLGTWRWSAKTSSPSAGQFIVKEKVCVQCVQDISGDCNRLNVACMYPVCLYVSVF